MGDLLRRLDDDALARFFTYRPELLDPPPATWNDLASRATVPYSVHACLQQLNQPAREVLDSLVYLGEPSSALDVALVPSEHADVSYVEGLLAVLWEHGLVEPHDIAPGMARSWSIPPGVRRLLPAAFGLRPPFLRLLDGYSAVDLRTIVSNLGLDPVGAGKMGLIAAVINRYAEPGFVEQLLSRAPGQAERFLRGVHNELGGVLGLDTRPWSRREIPEDIAWLLSHALLVPAGVEMVVVPREIALWIRGSGPLTRFSTEPPQVHVVSGRDLASKQAGIIELAPSELLAALVTIGTLWGREAPVPLRSGGVGVREIRAAAKAVGVDEVSCGRLIELGGIADLFVVDPVADRIGPTPSFDDWLLLPARERWLALVRAWRDLAGTLSRDGGDAEGERVAPPLSGQWYRSVEHVWHRAQVLDALASAPEDQPVDLASVASRARWFSPGRWGEQHTASAASTTVVEEAALLGLFRGGCLSPLGRLALFGAIDELASTELIDRAFPSAVQTFTVSGDHTVLAPSELDGVVGAQLGGLAEIVSKGQANVYRITEASLRAAFDDGQTAEEILQFLRAHSVPAVPQTLEYLVTDVQRRYGSVKVGSAASYVRCDDPALLAEILRAKKVGRLRLRLVAPTVAISEITPVKLLTGLRDAGFLPVAEDAAGAIVVAGPPKRANNPYRPQRRPVDDAADSIWRLVGTTSSFVEHPRARAVIDRLRTSHG